ncbi:MAG: hypothetical protein AB7L90_12990 [Hyphomicrobiaceae bacterium]
MTPGLQRAKRSVGRLVVGIALLALPGCGGIDGVELNGKVFEAVGLTGALGGKKSEPKTEQRAPLVLPPSTERLPEPGESVAPPAPVQTAQAAWPNDPDKQRVASESAKNKAQADYCRDGNWKERAMGDDLAASQGPNGSCGSLFSVLGKQLFGD